MLYHGQYENAVEGRGIDKKKKQILRRRIIDNFQQFAIMYPVETHRRSRVFRACHRPTPFCRRNTVKDGCLTTRESGKEGDISQPRGNLIPGGSRYGHFSLHWQHLQYHWIDFFFLCLHIFQEQEKVSRLFAPDSSLFLGVIPTI